MGAIRTKRGFERLPDLDVSKLTGKTIGGFTGNPDLTDPPVTVTVLTGQKETYDGLIIKADKGGSLATARKNAQRGGDRFLEQERQLCGHSVQRRPDHPA